MITLFAEARREFPKKRVVVGVAVEQIASWILAAAGNRHSESVAAAAATSGNATLESLLAQLEKADIANLPADASSLRAWLASADAAFPK